MEGVGERQGSICIFPKSPVTSREPRQDCVSQERREPAEAEAQHEAHTRLIGRSQTLPLFALLIWVLFCSYLISYITDFYTRKYVSCSHLFPTIPLQKSLTEWTKALTSLLVTLDFMQAQQTWKGFTALYRKPRSLS